MLHRREELYLCEQDSTGWVYFCVLEFLMLWWKKMRRASLSIMNRLVISVRLGMLGM